MKLTIRNLKTDRLINMGTIQGHMLCLAPGEEKSLTEEESDIFQNQIINYAQGGFISVRKEIEEQPKTIKPAAKKVLKDKTVVDKKTKNTLQEG